MEYLEKNTINIHVHLLQGKKGNNNKETQVIFGNDDCSKESSLSFWLSSIGGSLVDYCFKSFIYLFLMMSILSSHLLLIITFFNCHYFIY